MLILAPVVWFGLYLIAEWGERDGGRQTECMSNLHFVGQAMQLYRTDSGAYPPFDSAKDGPGLMALVKEGYLEKESSPKALICPDNRAGADSYDVFEGKVVYNYWGYGPDPRKWAGYSVKPNAVRDKRDRKRRYLAYPNCPGDTIIAHCCYHRAFYGSNRSAWVDLVLYLNGSTEKVNTLKAFPALKRR